jgi:hypothetical protein
MKGEYIEAIANYCPNIELLNLEHCICLTNLDFIPLKNLHHIRSLNVYRTRIDYRTLLPLIDNNKNHLENINLGKIIKKKQIILYSFIITIILFQVVVKI